MAKLVTKFKYMRDGQSKYAGRYAKYIATRDGVEKIDESEKLAPATAKQKQLIQQIIEDFVDSREMLEYEDYLDNPTAGNATEFINRALEDNIMQMVSNNTYADYIANRPRVQKFGKHGLFTDEGIEVELSQVSNELDAHRGNIWTTIISLRREDAERLGFDDGTRWRDMLRTQTETLASNLKIPMENLRWYAAFHNESHHPHVHMIAYSVEPREGYLTKKGVHNLRSALVNDIFSQDLICIYEKQTEQRTALRRDSREKMKEIISEINQGTYDNPIMEELLLKLAFRLSHTSGKKVYGYLKADVKAIINRIVDELEKDERIANLYDLWYGQKEQVHGFYSRRELERLPLSQNKEFKSIRNAVIQEALSLMKEGEEKQSEGINTTVGMHSVMNLFYRVSKIFQDKLNVNRHIEKGIDRRLRRKMEEKKQAQGLR